jgi:hypothetical protein
MDGSSWQGLTPSFYSTLEGKGKQSEDDTLMMNIMGITVQKKMNVMF